MKLDDLVKGIQECACGKEHKCPIKHVIIEKGALSRISEIAAEYGKILTVCDENTYRVCGYDVENEIKDKICGRVVFGGGSVLIPNEAAIEKIKSEAAIGCDMIIGIGSGVINDLCKYVSFLFEIPYIIVATAPSMDGYASHGAALILSGMKVTLNAHVPFAIVADTDILRNAPLDMILSGYGDIIGKYSCLCDWKLAAAVRGEYICDFVLNETYGFVNRTRALARGLLKRAPEAVEALIAALVAVGILMAYVGNSRPASGSEHHFSHYFEIVGIVRGEKYLPHGIDVFYSAAESAKIREQILSLTKEDIHTSKFDARRYKKDIKRIYADVADEVISLQEKLGWYSEIDLRVECFKNKYDEIRKILSEAPSFSEMCQMLGEVGMSYSDFLSYYEEEKISDAYLYAKDLKDRYTVLWLYYDLFGTDGAE